MNLKQKILQYTPRNEQESGDRELMLDYITRFRDILTRDNPLVHFTASSWIVNTDRTKVLMAYHNIYQSWAWTGGHADGESDLLKTALREAQEETSIRSIRPVSEEILSLEILTVCSHFKRGKYVAPHLHLNLTFLLEADDKQTICSKADENSAVCWFSPEEALEKCSEPEMRPIYRKLNDRIHLFD